MNTRKIKFGAAGLGGTYRVFGDTFANLVTSKNKKYSMEVKTTAGSAANLRLLSDGYIQMAIAQMDLTNDAYERTGIFENEKKHGGYSAVAALYTEACQVVVRADSGINTIEDLQDKRVSVGEEESGTEQNAKQILAVYGLNDSLVDEGEHVKKGQVLFKLSSAELYEEVKEAQANHKQAQAELKMAEVEVDRIKRLVEKDIISPIRLEQAMAEADVARLQVQQAKSRLQRAETNFSYTTITAPFEGYVDRIPFKVGSFVTPSSLLTSLTDVSDMFAYFKINEKEYLEYKRTQLSGIDQPEYNNLELILSDQSTYRYKGKVETVEGDFERGTGSIAFRARFANPERLLRHGVSGKIRMLTKMENVVLVPQQSTFEIQDFTYVYTVAEDGKVSVRSFEPLARHGSYYVTQDLPDQTVIVYEGVQMITDGMTINPDMVDGATIRRQLESSNEIENNK